jgi:hypothetical protein
VKEGYAHHQNVAKYRLELCGRTFTALLYLEGRKLHGIGQYVTSYLQMSVSISYEYHLLISVVIVACTTRYSTASSNVNKDHKSGNGQRRNLLSFPGQSQHKYQANSSYVHNVHRGLLSDDVHVMWILANLVLFRTRPNQELTLRDFIAFIQANKYKLY